jgi:hypothetical protein
VQLSDSAFQHRNLFLTSDGKTKYLTIPFVKKNYRQIPLRELEIADATWRMRHWDFLWNNYRRHPFAADVLPALERYYATDYETVFSAVFASMQLTLALFDIRTRVILQSTLDYDRGLRRGDLVLALAKAADASCYLSGTGARAYLDVEVFERALPIRFLEFKHPGYRQFGSSVFHSGLSSLDLLFNVGIPAAHRLLSEGSVQ